MQSIAKILLYAQKNKASDVHLASGNPPSFRIDGEMRRIGSMESLTNEQVESMLEQITTKEQREHYSKNLELDFAIQISKDARFRVNAFKNINGSAIVLREIPMIVKSLEELNTPLAIRELTKVKKGLILVVGATGSGKSTTLAAMIDSININYHKHIITVEDPVEFVHHPKKSIINQREIGASTKSFANALRGALRENPDVILVGEMRDKETIELALTAAETGHLVFGTLHTNSAASTVNRIVDVFAPEEKDGIRSALANSMCAVISQSLLKKNGGGRCAVFEIMIANNSIRNLIREDKIAQINSIIELNQKLGMCLMASSLRNLFETGLISQETYEFELSNNRMIN